MIKRDRYLRRLIDRKHNGFVKIITGIRRCGKSYLLFKIFKDHLLANGVAKDRIVEIALDDKKHAALKDPLRLADYIERRIKGRGWHYVFIDEIQECLKVLPPGIDLARIAPEDRENAYVTFYTVLNGLLHRSNLDVYVTGSNSRLLSSDIATNFRDRGDEVRLHPLSFSEYAASVRIEKAQAWERYLLWGGMPGALAKKSDEERKDYLDQLFRKVYFKDIVERNHLKEDQLLGQIADVLSSAVGSLTNAKKIADTIATEQHVKTNQPIVSRYIRVMEDSYLFSRVKRYDVKGRRYLASPEKFYAEDLGLRNVRLNLRQFEETHLMENAIYNELLARGCSVDVGVVEYVTRDGGRQQKHQAEIDFIVNLGREKVYVQSAFALTTDEKRIQETTSLVKSGDFFRKIVVVSGFREPTADENGIVYVGVIPFLLDDSILTGGGGRR